MSSCLFRDQMFPLSPPTFILSSPGSLWAFQGPGLSSTGLPIPGLDIGSQGLNKVNKPSATEEIKRGRGQLGLGKAHKDKADSPAGP